MADYGVPPNPPYAIHTSAVRELMHNVAFEF